MHRKIEFTRSRLVGIILFLIFFLVSGICWSQPTVYHKTITIPAKDSIDVKLDGVYYAVVFYSATDSSTVKLNIDSSFQTTRVVKYSDGSQATALLLASGVYEIFDLITRTIRFINEKTSAKIIELKARR